jgi:hypothetical protein
MDDTLTGLLEEVTVKIASALESSELRPGSNAFVLSGPITLVRPEAAAPSTPQPPKTVGIFRGFYAT